MRSLGIFALQGGEVQRKLDAKKNQRRAQLEIAGSEQVPATVSATGPPAVREAVAK